LLGYWFPTDFRWEHGRAADLFWGFSAAPESRTFVPNQANTGVILSGSDRTQKARAEPA
jgi:hypothetical protein